MCVPLAPHVVSHAPVQLSSLRWARSMVAERGVRRGVAGRGRRELRALLTTPPPQGFQGVKGARSSGGPGEIKILQGPTTWQAWTTPRLQHQQLRTHNSHDLSAL